MKPVRSPAASVLLAMLLLISQWVSHVVAAPIGANGPSCGMQDAAMADCCAQTDHAAECEHGQGHDPAPCGGGPACGFACSACAHPIPFMGAAYLRLVLIGRLSAAPPTDPYYTSRPVAPAERPPRSFLG
jgi:hypothetical protein